MASARSEYDKQYDLVVIGGTPAGIACAARAAREGLKVVLVNHNQHIGGILSSGLGVWDSQWEGKRSPIYDEVRAAFLEHYKKTYGEKSPQYRDALPGKSGYTNGRFEPRVAEKILTDLLTKERNIDLILSCDPGKVEVGGDRIDSVTVNSNIGGLFFKLRAAAFADCTYEGDFAALCKVPYRVGREARTEFNEPHAGIVFMRPVSQPPTPEAAMLASLHNALKLRKFNGWQVILPQSTGAADGAVQACNYRTILSTDAANRMPIAKPENYDPYFIKQLEIFSGVESIPNSKFGWNRPQLIGKQTEWVEADWTQRQRIMDEHWEMTLGLLYFLQNDNTGPELVRKAYLEYGLAKDEFTDNGNRPYELYIREARRITGRAIYTQHDAMLAPGLLRAPVHGDSIAVTEWYMDSHSCTSSRVPGAMEEGKAMLQQETFPGQIPYACMLPQGIDNLLVPLCLSATHVAWGTVRLEPVFMQTGESAGLAIALAKTKGIAPAKLDPNALVSALAARGSMLSFFNDSEAGTSAAAQYFGTRGFFHDYNVRADEPLKAATAKAWAVAFEKLLKSDADVNETARAVCAAESAKGTNISSRFPGAPPCPQNKDNQHSCGQIYAQ